jgi:putative Mg2+ transporter-C (MgtC) family protein
VSLASAASQFVVLGEVAVAMALGGAIGFEREAANRPAGFRTHMLVAGAAALLVAIGDALVRMFGHEHPNLVSADPFRLVGGVVAAIGFIGAGTIFRKDGRGVEGLTTAASLLFSGGIGIAVGIRQWWLAVGATVLALLVLRGLQQIEGLIRRRGAARDSKP